jgi:hypothetical protein
MHFKEVSFTKIYANSSFLNDRIGVVVSINEGEDAMQALHEAAKLSDAFHKERNPEVYKHNEKPLTAEEASLLEDIKNATDAKKLGMIKNHLTDALKPYYAEKLKTFTNNFATHD